MHNVHQEEDSADFCKFYQTMLVGKSRSLHKTLGLMRTSFLIWQGRSPSVYAYFKRHPTPALCTVELVFEFIKNHRGSCGDGKTGESRFISHVGMGQNAEYCAAVLATFEGDQKAALVDVAKAVTIEEAYKAMCDLKVFGGVSSTLYKIKGLLAPIGIADQAGKTNLLAWSTSWGLKAMSGPNSNKWHAVWNNESGKYKKKFRRRIPEYEAANKDGAKRLNVLLPRRLVIKRPDTT